MRVNRIIVVIVMVLLLLTPVIAQEFAEGDATPTQEIVATEQVTPLATEAIVPAGNENQGNGSDTQPGGIDLSGIEIDNDGATNIALILALAAAIIGILWNQKDGGDTSVKTIQEIAKLPQWQPVGAAVGASIANEADKRFNALEADKQEFIQGWVDILDPDSPTDFSLIPTSWWATLHSVTDGQPGIQVYNPAAMQFPADQMTPVPGSLNTGVAFGSEYVAGIPAQQVHPGNIGDVTHPGS